MKKLFYLAGFFIFFLSMVNPVAAGPLNGVERQDPLPGYGPTTLTNPVYMPVVMSPLVTFTVSGQITDLTGKPVSGVSVTSDNGGAATTNANGVYSMRVEKGDRAITASKTGTNYDPKPAWIKLNRNYNNVNFSGAAACTNPVPNPSFETVPFYWNPISGSANGFTPVYTTLKANTGTHSGLTGILPGYPNLPSWSRWRTHEITIPISATSADVTLFYWPQSSETVSVTMPQKTPDLAGLNADSDNLPTASDAIYIAAVDEIGNFIDTPVLWTLSNAQAWTSSGTLSLLAYAGRTIKLEFGTVNDGMGGFTSAFFDDVTVTVCDNTATLPSGCSNILLDSDFSAGSGWTIRTAVNPSVYSTLDFYSTPQSMLSGVAIGATPPVQGGFATSEFYQQVTVPLNATSATLKMRLKPRSSDLLGYKVEEQAAIDSLLAKGQLPEATESQYAYLCSVCDPNVTTINTLFFWPSIDSANWLYREYKLVGFQGQTFGVLFGAADFGDSGNTSLFVDDVFLEVCVP